MPLTSKEMKAVEGCRGLDGYADLLSIIDRLVKENEELQKERASCEVWTNYHNTNINNAKLRDNLSALLSAVSEVIDEYKRDTIDRNPVRRYFKIERSINNLSTVAAGVRGGKG